MKSFELDLGALGIAAPVTVTIKAPQAGAAPRQIDLIDLGIPVALVLMGTPLQCKCCGSFSFKEEGVFAEIRYRNFTDYTPLTPANAFMFASLPRRKERLTAKPLDFCTECWDFDEMFNDAIKNPQLNLFVEDSEPAKAPDPAEVEHERAAALHKRRKDPSEEDLALPTSPLDMSAILGETKL